LNPSISTRNYQHCSQAKNLYNHYRVSTSTLPHSHPHPQEGDSMPGETQEPTTGSQAPAVVNWLRIGLIAAAEASRQRLMRTTGLNETDVANRAFQIADPVESHLRDGYELVFRHPTTGQERILEVGGITTQPQQG
jgi:hypothetical protein